MITPQELVQAGLYPDEKTVIEEAMRILWQERPQLRIDWAIHQYRTRDIVSLLMIQTLQKLTLYL